MDRIIRISDFGASELDVYARLNEAQLLHYYEPAEGLFIAEIAHFGTLAKLKHNANSQRGD